MPSASSLVLNDGTNDKTYVPVAVSAEKSLFVDRSSDTAAGNSKLILGLSEASKQRPTHRVTIRFDKPVEYTDTDTGVTSVLCEPRVVVDVVLPWTMTDAQRVVFWNLFQAAIANSTVAGYVESLEPVW